MVQYPTTTYMTGEDDRFLLAPFLLGGVAGTALGYGIANNNNPTYYPPYPMIQTYPIYPTYPVFPAYSNSNNYFYEKS